MTYQKCERCKLPARESSKAFYKRTSVCFKVPFICAACLRIIASFKPADFRPHIVHPKQKKPPAAKKCRIEGLGLPDEICVLHAKFGNLSVPFLQRKLKMGFKEAERIVKLIEEHVNER